MRLFHCGHVVGSKCVAFACLATRSTIHNLSLEFKTLLVCSATLPYVGFHEQPCCRAVPIYIQTLRKADALVLSDKARM